MMYIIIVYLLVGIILGWFTTWIYFKITYVPISSMEYYRNLWFNSVADHKNMVKKYNQLYDKRNDEKECGV